MRFLCLWQIDLLPSLLPSSYLGPAMTESYDNLNQILEALQQLQLVNTTLWESLQELQATTHVLPNPTTEHYALEPKVNMFDKFDGTRAQLRSFINQVCLPIRLQPWFSTSGARRYVADRTSTGLVFPIGRDLLPLFDQFQIFSCWIWSNFRGDRQARTCT